MELGTSHVDCEFICRKKNEISLHELYMTEAPLPALSSNQILFPPILVFLQEKNHYLGGFILPLIQRQAKFYVITFTALKSTSNTQFSQYYGIVNSCKKRIFIYAPIRPTSIRYEWTNEHTIATLVSKQFIIVCVIHAFSLSLNLLKNI